MRDDSKLMKASLWLQEVLADGQKAAAEVRSAAIRAGITLATLRRARERLGIVVSRQGFGQGGRWCWRLPDAKDAHDGRLTCSEIDGINGELSLPLDLEPALDDETWAALDAELSGLELTEADLAFLDNLPSPARGRR
jgi:hypothetical protein